MEQEQTKEIGHPVFHVRWHRFVHADLAEINPGIVEGLIEAAEYRLSRVPAHIGRPLKGTTHKLWRITFYKYCIVYTIKMQQKEVWILAVQKPEAIYRHPQIIELLKLAVVIQEEANRAAW